MPDETDYIPKVHRIHMMLGQYPILGDVMRERMRQEMFRRGIITRARFEDEVRERAVVVVQAPRLVAQHPRVRGGQVDVGQPGRAGAVGGEQSDGGGQHPDQRDLAALRNRLERLRQRSGAAHLDDVIRAAAVRDLEHLLRPRTAGLGLEVFAADDTSAQLTWAELPEGRHDLLLATSGGGTAEVRASGAFVYTPAPGFSGEDTFTYTVSDGQATSAPATVTIEIGTRWVLQGGPVINRWEARREFEGGTADPEYFGEERFAGMFTRYSVDAGSITWADRSVDHGYEAHNISIQCAFDAPPPVLYAGDAIPLEVRFSHSGSVTEGNPGLRFQFFAGTPLGDDPLAWEDWQQRRIVDPAGPAAYFPWEAGFSGVNEATWTLQVPEGRVGDALAIQAGLWNCAPCNVTWVYRAE